MTLQSEQKHECTDIVCQVHFRKMAIFFLFAQMRNQPPGAGRNAFASNFFENLDWSKILDFRNFTPDEQRQLLNVYSLLLAGILVTALGSITGIHLTSWLSVGAVELIGLLASVASVFYIHYRNATEIRQYGKGASIEQVAAFGGFSFSTGLTLVGLLLHAMFFDPRILFTALLGATAIFTSLTFSALLSPRRSYFFLSSVLGTLTTYLLFASLAGIFIPSSFLFSFLTWGGLIGGIGYTLVDTQIMSESIRQGNRNAVTHCLMLYMDAIRVFVYLLSILLRREENRERRRKH
eukprot:Gregarina_sp_Poly_1__10336@NODE_733_length_6558_cov_196_911416_g76_i2_p2_GENE_NODE_733_length_6558_cov_196_911416_g76_i2NODE_733_length_6558_cov_196_911416_g76_i2_p2_ORF_typecomplete_len293_score19_80Bax1I/PF01027_20/2_9e24DUF4781/PF16013_5/2_3e02DUF4781/PF16013_5/0_38Phage_holin_8/PF16931_5/2_3e03Phage_holin_8/PF16931_5/0_095SLATT_3/PF18184_1/0_82SLATT_3/PF18184_1/5_8e02_NODE_733_length_6558_cov_196_911416_g76_i2121999